MTNLPSQLIKVKPTLEEATKAQRGSRGITLLFSLPRRQIGWVVKATTRPIYPRERPGTNCIGGWVGPRAGLDNAENLVPPPELDPRTVQTVASRHTDWDIPAHITHPRGPTNSLNKEEDILFIREDKGDITPGGGKELYKAQLHKRSESLQQKFNAV
jgi:hypothetical protein